MTSKDLYCKGSQVWISHPTLVWEAAEVVSDYNNNELKIQFEDGRTETIKVDSEASLPPLRNPEILIGENDLTALSYLHEPAVLHNLKYRFCTLYTIYTYCGIVLVAINPYDELQIYDNDTILTYRGKSQGDLDPHIFAVAEEAYAKLEREGKDQSIIVSGESGAGKTVSAKYAMRYFATVGGSSEETQVEKKVLSSSPIMEAIGNAKTTRNDNSSRFGKFIEIRFNKNYHIVGASMRTYLLEKSRVVFQAPSERNYHIFYQLCSAREKLPYLHLDHQDKFLYLNQGESPVIDGVNDYSAFEETVQALNTLGFTRSDQETMFKILAAILHIGNVVINREDEGSNIKKDDPHLKVFCDLLELSLDDMRCWLCQRKITSMKEVFNKPMSLHEAVSAKEALSKYMYAHLFDWIVSVINGALETTRDKADHRLIGVLDIYGFETFEVNSFEQFCINYANEKLQQQFNQHVFKLEQEEYLKEEIEWKFIDFYDNQPCIDLIESKLGILDLLDEECRVPKGSDLSWAEKLYKTCSKYKHFSKPRFGASAFIIQHFADQVEYQADGFLDKNRDSVIEEQIIVIKQSKNDHVRKLFGSSEDNRQASGRIKILPSKPAEKSKQHKKTVGSQFRDNLNLLMATLNATTPHYVRCIKPNDFKKAFDYNSQRAVQQLRACGVLETIRISAAGFPSRWLYGDFFARYRVLCKFRDIDRSDMKMTCSKILSNNITEPDKYQFGKTKIFFRAGQVAFLEKLRAERLRAYCITIQKQIRAFILRKKYLRTKRCIYQLQKYIRGYLARRHALHLRQTKAAVTMQRYVRGWMKRRQYLRLRNLVVGLQTHIRSHIARKNYLHLKYNHKAVVIQRHVRGFLARQKYNRDVRRVIICQNAVRRFFARKKLKELKKEARSVEHVKKLNKGLENKIISLQQKIGELSKENNQLKSLQTEYNELRVKLDGLKHMEIELKKTMNNLSDKEKEINLLNERIIQEQNEKMDILQEASQDKENLKKYMDQNENLKAELDSMNEKIKKNQFGVEENIKARIQQEKRILIHEHEQDLENYQKLLKEYSVLEQKNENLENLIEKLTSRHSRSPSDISSLQSSQTSAEVENDDFGYSSNKSTISRRDDVEYCEKDRSITTFTIKHDDELGQPPDVDVALVLKLQQKLKDVEKERDKLFQKVEILEKEESPTEESQRTMDGIRLEHLEIENEKLKNDLGVLRESLAMGDPGTKELLNQFRASEKELDRRRDEIVQLRTVLATQTRGLKNIAKINYGSTNDINLEVINEDGELIMAFEAQKGINRQLEEELQQEKDKRRLEKEEYRIEIEKLKEDNDRQQKLLSVNLNKTPQSQTEAYMQHEISRLTAENLDLQEKFDTIQESTRKLKKQNKFLLKKLKELGVGIDQVELQEQASGQKTENVVKKPEEQNSSLPNVMMKKERNYQGMFEYRSVDEPLIIKHLIYDLKPRTAMYLLPGLPAYIFFMCIRHTDFVNDDNKVKSLLTAFINAVKKLIKKKHDDLETTVLWLSNTLRLLHNLKQYSGDKVFQQENTPKQNEQCLRNFDLSQYRQVLSDMALWIYQGAIRDLQEKIQHLIVPAILEHEAISGFSKGLAGRQRASSVSNALDGAPNPQMKLDALLAELTGFHRILAIFGVDPEVISQVFRQTFYFICACSLNNLLLRKDLCNWTKGMQIRYNLSHLEEWSRQQLLTDSLVTDPLQPIIQASHLLQARKKEEDIKSLCEMCDRLPVQRIVKLLHLYTPADDYEEKVPVSFLRKIQAELRSRTPPDQKEPPLLMDTKFVFPVRFPFNPSNIRLEDIEMPADLDLPMLKKV